MTATVAAMRREPPVMFGRTPPHDLDLEAVVLSAAMLSADAADEVMAIVLPCDFYSEPNRMIAAAIVELMAAGEPVDVAQVGARLRERGQIQRVDVAYLGRIVDMSPAVHHVGEHAVRLRELAHMRRIIDEGHRLVALGYGPITYAELMSEAHSFVDAVIAPRPADGGACMIRETVPEAMRHIIEPDTSRVTATGIIDLDDKLNDGMRPGQLIVVGARPSQGKTALLDHIEMAAAGHGHVLSCSVEMSRRERTARKLCATARVDLGRFLSGRLGGAGERDGGPSEMDRINAATAALEALPIHIDDAGECSLLRVQTGARRAARAARAAGSRLALVTIDYLGLMSTRERRGGTRDAELGEVTRGLKVLAKQLECPIVLAQQLNRQVESRASKRPQLADLRETGCAEQDADVVVLLYRDEYYNPRSTDRKGIAELIIAKQRNGATGSVWARFEARWTRYDNLSAGESDRWESES